MLMRIKGLREAVGMTQQELANAMGVVRGAVTNWETEISLPRARQFPQLVKVLGCDYNALFVEPSLDDGPAPDIYDQYTA